MDHKDKIVVILGSTGAGKSKLSIDLATHFPSEIINSDKIQLYKGLKITTNQITSPERRNVPHHLLGYLPPESGDLTAGEFRFEASNIISDIISRKKLPIIAGGSNSFIHALVTESHDSKIDPFTSGSDLIHRNLRYDICFIWIDVSETVLFKHLTKRVDEMVNSGLLEELSDFYDPGPTRVGLKKAIGVPEFDEYFKLYPPEKNDKNWDFERKAAYDNAVKNMKENTLTLAKRQIKKIEKLRNAGWVINRVDATTSFEAVMNSSENRREIWEKEVLMPSVKFVNQLLEEN